MDFWDQQALMESDNRYEIYSIQNAARAISHLQNSITHTIYLYNTINKSKIKYSKASASEVCKQLLRNKYDNVEIFSIDEIPESVSSSDESEMYRKISDKLTDFNISNEYLYARGSDGTYTIKANNKFYNRFKLKNESTIDFFEEEAIRLNEGFFTKNETQKFIADNKDKIISYINIATNFVKPLVNKSKYKNDYVPGKEVKSFCMDELKHSAKNGNLKCVVGMFEYDEEREKLIKDKIAKFKNNNFKLTVEYRKIDGEEYSEVYMNINT